MRGENGAPQGNLITQWLLHCAVWKQVSFQLTSKLKTQRLNMWRGLGSSASILMGVDVVSVSDISLWEPHGGNVASLLAKPQPTAGLPVNSTAKQ